MKTNWEKQRDSERLQQRQQFEEAVATEMAKALREEHEICFVDAADDLYSLIIDYIPPAEALSSAAQNLKDIELNRCFCFDHALIKGLRLQVAVAQNAELSLDELKLFVMVPLAVMAKHDPTADEFNKDGQIQAQLLECLEAMEADSDD